MNGYSGTCTSAAGGADHPFVKNLGSKIASYFGGSNGAGSRLTPIRASTRMRAGFLLNSRFTWVEECFHRCWHEPGNSKGADAAPRLETFAAALKIWDMLILSDKQLTLIASQQPQTLAQRSLAGRLMMCCHHHHCPHRPFCLVFRSPCAAR